MFADVVCSIREKLGLTPKEFGEAVGVVTTHFWENASRYPNLKEIVLLEEYCKSRGIDDSELRQSYIEEKRIQGYTWKSGMISWDEGYKKLCKYLQEHGSYPPAPSPLGIWVTHQRTDSTTARRMSAYHRQLLDSISFEWEADTEKEAKEWEEATWQYNYNRVLQRIEDIGHMPNDFWIEQQKKVKSHTPEHQELLNKIGLKMVPGSIITESLGEVSREQLADALNVLPTTIKNWEKRMFPEYRIREILEVIDKLKEA